MSAQGQALQLPLDENIIRSIKTISIFQSGFLMLDTSYVMNTTIFPQATHEWTTLEGCGKWYTDLTKALAY